jgi:hypothetical protein
MIFDEDTEDMLREEIHEIGESMMFQVNFYSPADDKLLGQAMVELWVMIEDSCNIVRKVRTLVCVMLWSLLFRLTVQYTAFHVLFDGIMDG